MTQQDKRISIIVPVYNAEKFLLKCLDSIVNQDYLNLEIILVDDGSSDKSGEICDKYALADSRITVIHKENGGVSAARNTGLAASTGDYIAFVDSDDYIEPNMYSTMINIINEYDCDIAMCDCVKEFADHTEVYSHNIRAGYYGLNDLKNEYYENLLITPECEYPPTISNCVLFFNRKCCFENGELKIRYADGIKYSEDLFFGAQLMYNAQSFYYLKNEYMYHYVANAASATHTFNPIKWKNYLDLHKLISEHFCSSDRYDFSDQINRLLLFFLYNSINDILHTSKINIDKKHSLILDILNDSATQQMFKKIDINSLNVSKKQKVLTYCYKYKIAIKQLIARYTENASATKKSVLFTNGHVNCGGVERSLVDILKNFNFSEYDVDLLLFEDYGDYVDEIPNEVNIRLLDLHNTYGNVKDSLIRCLKNRDFKCFAIRIIFIITKLFGISKLSLGKRLFTKNKHYDYAIGFRPGICMDVVAFATNADKKIGWWHHGTFNLNDNEATNFITSAKRIDTLVAVSNGCKHLLSEAIPEIKEKIVVIPNMIDKDKITEKSSMQCVYDMDKNLVNFLTVGRLSEEKHVENAILASASFLKNGFSDFRWHIVGDGEEKDELIEMANKYNVTEHVVFHGNQSNPYSFMKQADMLVHTSYVESQCLVVLEAMAVGLPCVVTKSLGPSEFAKNDINCIFVEPNLENLIRGIEDVLKHASKSDMISAASLTVKDYSSDKVMKQLYHLFLVGGIDYV